MMDETNQRQFHELSFYTLAHPDATYFIHQLIVDAYHAQTADTNTKPVTITFALVGLYMFCELGATGRQIQQAHMQLAKNKKMWPTILLPPERGNITVTEVLKTTEGEDRDRMIKQWCNSVWQAYANSHAITRKLAQQELGL